MKFSAIVRLLVALSLAGVSCLPALADGQKRPIRLRNETILPEHAGAAQATAVQLPEQPSVAGVPGAAAVPQSGQNSVSGPLDGLFLVQFDGPLDAEDRSALEGLNVDLIAHVPDDAFVARFSGTPPGRVRSLPFVTWLGHYRPDHKIEARLQGRVAAVSQSDVVEVSLLLAPRCDATARSAVGSLLQQTLQEHQLRQGTVLRGALAAGKLQELAESPAVLWIEPSPQMRLYDEESSKIVGGDDGLRSTPTIVQQLGYDGSGVTVAVADSGLDSGDPSFMHPDLAGRVGALFYYGNLTDASDEHSHGTHVAGIIAGNATVGETDPYGALYGLGVAPGARIVGQRIFDGVGGYEAPPSFAALTQDAVAAGAEIGNNSWGEDNQGRYDITAMEFDALVRDADTNTPGDQPYILEFSAGNAGPGPRTIGTPAVAKNVIASGAAQNNRFDFFLYAEGQETMADFSSRGPCEDGRIKPDVVAPGTWIASLRSVFADDNNAWAEISPSYMYQGGTSQSGPHVAGAAAVFVQYYREVHGATPSPALVKAALINSAVPLLDSFGPVPNQHEGWGRVDLTEVIGTPRTVVFLEQTNLLTTGASFETTVAVEDSGEPLKITLTYTDVPGFPAAIPALVNDLDLEVVGPDGARYRGNQFDESESLPNAPLTDRLNNVEGFLLSEPPAGEYRIRIHAHHVPEDACRDTPAVDQDFALVISGGLLPAGKALIYTDRHRYRAPDSVLVGVIDRDQAGAGSVNVSVSSNTETNGETLALFPGASAGVFTNRISTATNSPTADGSLQVSHNDTIRARYFDTSTGATRTATATADLLAPVLTGVGVTNQFGKAIVKWNTDEPSTSTVEWGTNTALGLTVTHSKLTGSHSVELEDLITGATYYFRVSSTDEAGNAATNDNGGLLFTLVAPDAAPVLIVDAYQNDLLFDPPLSAYTAPLAQLGVLFEVWDPEVLGSPDANDLRPFQVVIWRCIELTAGSPITPSEQQALTDYLAQGGSLFISSMELTTRLEESSDGAFRSNVLHVATYVEDVAVPAATGVEGDPIGAGLSLSLDFSTYFFDFDLSDAIAPMPDATTIFTKSGTGQPTGLRFPRAGMNSASRVVFLSFPFEAISGSAPAPNNRTEVLRRILQFLSPGITGDAVISLDRAAYPLPGVMTVEVGDADQEGAGQLNGSVRSTTEPAGRTVVLRETTRPGLFRGQLTVINATNAPSTNQLRAVEGDTLTARYFDASKSVNVEVSVRVDATAPRISLVDAEPDYSTATIYWSTDEPADSLVQYGESLPLPINRTQFDPALTPEHAITLAGLQPGRTYFYQVVSRDAAGNATVDNNTGSYYQLATLTPLNPPFTDMFETGATNNWTTFSSDESESQWTLGVPNNGVETNAVSPVNAWGSVLNGRSVGLVDTFLISPAFLLTNGNQITLRFWHSYDFSELSEFDIIEGGILLLVENDTGKAVALNIYLGSNSGWEQETIDLTPWLGKVVYLVWQHQLLSLDNLPRAGWLVDNVEIAVDSVVAGSLTVSNNLSQATFTLAGPVAATGAGRWFVLSNAVPGTYALTFHGVPHYITPPPQTNTLAGLDSLAFTGLYTFPDANTNGISDLWEAAHFGGMATNPLPTLDSDGDGLSDYGEWVAGTDRSNALSVLKLKAPPELSNGIVRVTWTATTGRSYQVTSSTNLQGWSPVSAWVTPGAGQTSQEITVPHGARQALYRVEVRRDGRRADDDHDGATDYDEFIAGTDPNNGASRLALALIPQPNNLLRAQWPTAPGHGYRLESSSDAAAWTAVTPWTRASGSTLSHLFPRPTAPTLFRVQVQP